MHSLHFSPFHSVHVIDILHYHSCDSPLVIHVIHIDIYIYMFIYVQISHIKVAVVVVVVQIIS